MESIRTFELIDKEFFDLGINILPFSEKRLKSIDRQMAAQKLKRYTIRDLKKALWYINYSIDNDLPSFVDELSDSLEFQELVEKVKSHWVGNKYMFIDAVYWGNQETMKKALELMILELTSNQETHNVKRK